MTEVQDSHFAQLLRKHLPGGAPSRIFEIGTRDCLDAITFTRSFPDAMVYAFEPNPKTIPAAMANAASHPHIIVVPQAVCEHDGVTEFYQSATPNDGCSSLFPPSGKYDVVEPMPQVKITVPATRLDTFMDCFKIPSVDALWLDAQGAELAILKSLGSKLTGLQAVWTEFSYDHIYKDQPLLPDLTAFLEAAGIHFVWKQDVLQDPTTKKWWWGDAFYARHTAA